MTPKAIAAPAGIKAVTNAAITGVRMRASQIVKFSVTTEAHETLTGIIEKTNNPDEASSD